MNKMNVVTYSNTLEHTNFIKAYDLNKEGLAELLNELSFEIERAGPRICSAGWITRYRSKKDSNSILVHATMPQKSDDDPPNQRNFYSNLFVLCGEDKEQLTATLVKINEFYRVKGYEPTHLD